MAKTGAAFGAKFGLTAEDNVACLGVELAAGEVAEQGTNMMAEGCAERPADTAVVLEWAAKHILQTRKQGYRRKSALVHARRVSQGRR